MLVRYIAINEKGDLLGWFCSEFEAMVAARRANVEHESKTGRLGTYRVRVFVNN